MLENLKDYYVNDKYGGHISKKGNSYIARILVKSLNSTIELETKNANNLSS